ncbi:MAG: TolC family protein [Ginsengibacter sp.]
MKRIFVFFIALLCIQKIHGQDQIKYKRDSVKLDIQQAEQIFLSKNLLLIAQQYSIDSARATIITARLFDNPYLNYSFDFYQPETHKFFDFTNKSRETSIQISQLFKTAAKRNKAIKLATSGVEIVQFQFYDLLRTLRFTLRNDFYNIYFLEQSGKLYDQEINSLKSIVPAFEEEEAKGFIALKDVLRIKSQLYTLQAEYNDLQTTIDNIQSEFRLLLRLDPEKYILPVTESSVVYRSDVLKVPYQSLIGTALNNRPDIKALKAGITFSKNNLTLQKALAKPDVTLNLNYDRQGSYVKYFNSLGVGLPIPIFNKNQGNIKNAQIQVQLNNVLSEIGTDKVKNDISTSYITALRAQNLLSGMDPLFDSDLQKLNEEVFKNFKKRNLTILEFLDSYESYKQNVLQLNKLRFNKMAAIEQLNFSVGKIIF